MYGNKNKKEVDFWFIPKNKMKNFFWIKSRKNFKNSHSIDVNKTIFIFSNFIFEVYYKIEENRIRKEDRRIELSHTLQDNC